MTYRNDHDAAIARTEALSEELAHAVAERDRLRDALDQVRRGTGAARDREHIAVLEAARAELTAERDRLVVQLAGARAVRPRRRAGCSRRP